MNPMILRALTALGRFGGSPGGVPMSDSLSNFNLPEFAMAEFDETEANNSKKGMERLKGAFESLRDMHKRPEIAAMQGPMEAALVQGPQAPMGPEAPPMPQQAPMVPMPMQRPPQAPQPSPMEMAMSAPPEQAPMQEEMPWWKRNAYMQQDPTTGEYLNPMQAAQAMQGFA